MDALIETEGLQRRFGDRLAVDGIDFTLRRGEVLGLLGPNGAGKSTSLRMLSGCLAPSAGRIMINGVDLQQRPREAKRHLGYLPETPPLYPEMTVDEYLAYCARLKGIHRSRRQEAIASSKGRCGLNQTGGRLIANLSKGYRQRLGIAQAIIHQPSIVILDEPSSGLDPNQLREIRDLILELGQHCGVLLSTHILPEVQAVCDRVLIVNDGRQVYARDLRQLVRDETCNLLLRLGDPPSVAVLSELPGVLEVQQLEQQLFQLRMAPDAQPEQLAECAVENHWKLRELTPRQPELERIFSRITSEGADL